MPVRTPAPEPSRARRAPALAALLALVPPAWSAGSEPPPAAPGSSAPDPFAPGLRWVHAPDPAAPSIPAGVTFAANGEWVLAAPAYQTPSLALLASAPGGANPLFGSDAASTAGASGPIEVRAPESDPTRLFALVRVPAPGGGGAELARVLAHDPVQAAQAWPAAPTAPAAADLAPVWTYEPPTATTGGARLALDRAGATLALALQDPAAGTVRVDRLDPATGAPLGTAVLSGGTLRAFSATDAGELLLVAGAELRVLGPAFELVHAEALSLATGAVALSADGGTLLVGGLAGSAGRVRVLRRSGGAFVQTAELAAGPGELPIRVATSANGDTLAVAWWNAASGATTRLEVWDGAGAVLQSSVSQPGAAGGLQNYPQALALSADGARVALGLWGLGGAEPELLLLARGQPEPILALDLGGSVRDLALDPTGTRVAVALKHVHANQFGTTGEVRLYDTGERDLQVDGVARAGGTLGLVHRLPGALWTGFVLGKPLAAPLALPGVSGLFRLDPAAPTFLFGAAPDASGRAELLLALPPDPGLVGLVPAFQAVSLLGAPSFALSERLARPVVL